MFRGMIEPLSTSMSPSALLERAVRDDPDDIEALEARAGALILQRRHTEALATFEAVLAQSPRRERALAQAGGLAHQIGDRDRARRYWQQAVAANPWMPRYRHGFAGLLAEQQEWGLCREQCEAWLRLDPASKEARALLRRCQAANEPDSASGGGPPP